MDFLMNGDITPNYENNECMLFNCDCRTLLKNMEDESIDLFVSDIPYKISSSGGGKKKEGVKYAGGIFDYFNNTEENIENIKKR